MAGQQVLRKSDVLSVGNIRVLVLQRLQDSHYMHSRVSTGLQQRWVTGVWQVFFPCQGQVCLCLFLMAVLLRWDPKGCSSMVVRVAGWRLTQRVTGRSGPLARGCDKGFSVGVFCWMESDLEGDGLEWKEDARMVSRV